MLWQKTVEAFYKLINSCSLDLSAMRLICLGFCTRTRLDRSQVVCVKVSCVWVALRCQDSISSLFLRMAFLLRVSSSIRTNFSKTVDLFQMVLSLPNNSFQILSRWLHIIVWVRIKLIKALSFYQQTLWLNKKETKCKVYQQRQSTLWSISRMALTPRRLHSSSIRNCLISSTLKNR